MGIIKKAVLSTPFLAILCCLLWATPFVGIKIGLRYSEPLQFAGIRFTLAGLMILPFIPNLKIKWKSAIKHWKVMVIIALIQTTFLYSMFYIGLNMVPGYVGALIVGSGPVFVAITANFMMKDDKMNWQKVIAVIIGLVGLTIVTLAGTSKYGADAVDSVAKNSGIFTGTVTLGIILLLVKNFLGSVGNVYIARDANNINPRVLAAFSLVFGGILIILLSIILEKPSWNTDVPAEFYYSWIWLSIVSATAIAIWYSLLQRPGVKVSILNFWTFIIPVFGALFSWMILPGEEPDFWSIVGMIIIGFSLFFINYANRHTKKSTINKIKSYKRV
ncbi:MAG: DMT family transporter [Bacteroidales bacterium]